MWQGRRTIQDGVWWPTPKQHRTDDLFCPFFFPFSFRISTRTKTCYTERFLVCSDLWLGLSYRMLARGRRTCTSWRYIDKTDDDQLADHQKSIGFVIGKYLYTMDMSRKRLALVFSSAGLSGVYTTLYPVARMITRDGPQAPYASFHGGQCPENVMPQRRERSR
jgi:hypothetical protein